MPATRHPNHEVIKNREVMKNMELHFVVILCVRSIHAMPERGQDRSTKGAEGEENNYVFIIYTGSVRNYLLKFR